MSSSLVLLLGSATTPWGKMTGVKYLLGFDEACKVLVKDIPTRPPLQSCEHNPVLAKGLGETLGNTSVCKGTDNSEAITILG